MTGGFTRRATTAAEAAEVAMMDGESMSGDAPAVFADRQQGKHALDGVEVA
jgi:hypothetical protein